MAEEESATEKMISVAKKEMDRAFRDFDVDHSGVLEKNEFGQLIKRLAACFHV